MPTPSIPYYSIDGTRQLTGIYRTPRFSRPGGPAGPEAGLLPQKTGGSAGIGASQVPSLAKRMRRPGRCADAAAFGGGEGEAKQRAGGGLIGWPASARHRSRNILRNYVDGSGSSGRPRSREVARQRGGLLPITEGSSVRTLLRTGYFLGLPLRFFPNPRKSSPSIQALSSFSSWGSAFRPSGQKSLHPSSRVTFGRVGLWQPLQLYSQFVQRKRCFTPSPPSRWRQTHQIRQHERHSGQRSYAHMITPGHRQRNPQHQLNDRTVPAALGRR